MGSARAEAAGTAHPKSTTKLKLDTFITKFQGFELLAALFSLRMCIPTRVVSPAVTSTAGFLRANIARMNKSRPNPLSQQQQRRFTSMKPTNVVQINSIVGSFPPNALGDTIFRRTLYTQSQNGALKPLVVTAKVCMATPKYASIPGMNDRCQQSCLSYPPVCPRDECYCLSHCEATGDLQRQAGTDVYCHRNCLRYPPKCPKESCKCYKADSPATGSSISPVSYQPPLLYSLYNPYSAQPVLLGK